MIILTVIALFLLPDVDPLVHVGSLTEQLRSPARISVAQDGTVYVTDPWENRVVWFDSAGAFVGSWPIVEGPLGIGAHPDGRIFISLRDTNEIGIYVVNAGVLVRTGTLDGDGSPVVTFDGPTDIEIDAASGRIYVVDPEGDDVYGFNSDGSLAVKFGIHGEGNGQFMYPSAIAFDAANNRLIVADHDNFRGQVFDTSGVFQRRFGFRMIYLPGGVQEGWMPRTQGLAVDASGRMYVADALMSAVRLLDSNATHLGKVVTYGSGPGDVRTPCDLALSPDGSRLYVVSTNTSSVEIYQTPSKSASRNSGDDAFDPPGTDWSFYDTIGVAALKARGFPGMLGGRDARADYDGPHMIEATIICGRCHGITGQPGDHVGTLEGQQVLCFSCHSSGGQALDMPMHERDLADPYGTNPNAADGLGSSHAWGVLAVSADADSVGPSAGGEMERYLDDDGKIKCATCHNQHSGDAGSPYLRVNNTHDAMCKECHSPRNEGPGERGTHAVGFDYPGGEGEFPADGAISPMMLDDGMVECQTCHGLHNATSGGVNAGEGDGMLLRATNDDALCQICHTSHVAHDVGGPWQPGCKDCHDVHDPDNDNLSLVAASIHNQTLGEDKPVVFTARTGPNSFDDEDPAANDGVCQVCHTATSYHVYDGTGATHYGGQDCTTCHPHDNGFLPAVSCVGCHSSPQDNGDGVPPGGRAAVVNPDGTGGHDLGGGVLSDADCAVCHEMTQHMQGQVRLWEDPNVQVGVLAFTGDPSELVPFCGACHDDPEQPSVHDIGGVWEPVCTECHEVHDPANTNLSLVADVIHNQTLTLDMPVVFTARTGPSSFDDGDPAANDGVCQVCHTTTTYHLYDGTGVSHNDGDDCTSCHPHMDGFRPTAGSCMDCHNTPQDNGDGVPIGGRRAVVGEFPVGDAHAHYGAELSDDACVVCHDMTTHMDGYVDLLDADDGSLYTFIYASDLASDPDVSDFCQSCHDADGATRLATPADPFGGGNAAPDVATKLQGSLQWNEWYGDACFGEEGTLRGVNSHHDISDADQAFSGAKLECLNCHGSHNAGASQPLADPFDTATPWGGDGNEFCLACHDGGAGPADPGFPPGVVGPTIPLRGLDTCDYQGEPWYVDYTWTHSAHGLDSKRGWDGYSGAPGYVLDCKTCHDPHGSYTPSNPAGNPYMIRDFVDGTSFVDDGYRVGDHWTGPPWDTFGTARDVQITVSGLDVDWGGATGLCEVCHADWLPAQHFHDTCTACQTCHGHGQAFGEYDWVNPADDTPCPGKLGGAGGKGDPPIHFLRETPAESWPALKRAPGKRG